MDKNLPVNLLEKCTEYLEAEVALCKTGKALLASLKAIMDPQARTNRDDLTATAALLAEWRFITTQRMPLRHILPRGSTGRVLEQESDGVECTILGWIVVEASLRHRASLMAPWDYIEFEGGK